jgi:hypothetical protein
MDGIPGHVTAIVFSNHPINGIALRDSRVKIIHADIFQLPVIPEVNACWFDVWAALDYENMPQMLELLVKWNPNMSLDFCGCWSAVELMEGL